LAERLIVPDASVALKWLVDEEDSAAALRWRDAPSVRFHVPDLWYVEIGNAVWKRVRRGVMPPDTSAIATILSALASIRVTTHGGALLVDRATLLAIEARITVYDAAYVAVAELKQATLLTADVRLARALAGHTGIQIELLGAE
jgi:predicted nucleic acid-binding protein